MKTIIKNEATLECLQFAKEAGLDWNGFHDNDQTGYAFVRDKALRDQGYECAYTGLWIGEGTSQTIHLDHFRKKSIYSDLTFCWHNLFAAAKKLEYGSDYKDKQIHGPKCNADSQYQTFLSPLSANLENYFWYCQDGTIEPDECLSETDKKMAKRTIEMYNLNASDLRHKRESIIKMIRAYGKQLLDEEIRAGLNTSGFSFLIDFELKQLQD